MIQSWSCCCFWHYKIHVWVGFSLLFFCLFLLLENFSCSRRWEMSPIDRMWLRVHVRNWYWPTGKKWLALLELWEREVGDVLVCCHIVQYVLPGTTCALCTNTTTCFSFVDQMWRRVATHIIIILIELNWIELNKLLVVYHEQ